MMTINGAVPMSATSCREQTRLKRIVRSSPLLSCARPPPFFWPVFLSLLRSLPVMALLHSSLRDQFLRRASIPTESRRL